MTVLADRLEAEAFRRENGICSSLLRAQRPASPKPELILAYALVLAFHVLVLAAGDRFVAVLGLWPATLVSSAAVVAAYYWRHEVQHRRWRDSRDATHAQLPTGADRPAGAAGADGQDLRGGRLADATALITSELDARSYRELGCGARTGIRRWGHMTSGELAEFIAECEADFGSNIPEAAAGRIETVEDLAEVLVTYERRATHAIVLRVGAVRTSQTPTAA